MNVQKLKEERYINDFDHSRRLRLDGNQESTSRDVTPKRVTFRNNDLMKTQNKRKAVVVEEDKENIPSPTFDYGNLMSNTEKKRSNAKSKQEELEQENEEVLSYNSTSNSASDSGEDHFLLNQEMSQQYHLASINSLPKQEIDIPKSDRDNINRKIIMPQTPNAAPKPMQHQSFCQEKDNPPQQIPDAPRTPCNNHFHQHRACYPGETPLRPTPSQPSHFSPYPYNYPPAHQNRMTSAMMTPEMCYPPHFQQHSMMCKPQNSFQNPHMVSELYSPAFNPHLHESINPHQQPQPQPFFFPHQENPIFKTKKNMICVQNPTQSTQKLTARSKLNKMREKMKKKLRKLKKKRKKSHIDSSSCSDEIEFNTDSLSESDDSSCYQRKRKELAKKKKKKKRDRKRKQRRKKKDHDKVYLETLQRIEELQKMTDSCTMIKGNSYREYKKSTKQLSNESRKHSLVPVGSKLYQRGGDMSANSTSSMIERFKKNLEKLQEETVDPVRTESFRLGNDQAEDRSKKDIICDYTQRREDRLRAKERVQREKQDVKKEGVSEEESGGLLLNGQISQNEIFQSVEVTKEIKAVAETETKPKAPVKMEFDFSNVKQSSNPIVQTETKAPQTLAEAFQNKKQSMIERLKNHKKTTKVKREITFDKYKLHQKKKNMNKRRRNSKSVLILTTSLDKKKSVSKSPIKLPANDVMERLAKGQKSKVTKKEMYEINKRMRNRLPETKQKDIAKRKKEDFMKRQAKLKAFNKVSLISLTLYRVSGIQ